ncbi:phospholipase D/nuclease [Hyaloscypha variabilis F]|uniref:Phospholipase D/nuclease n=1 Tax=Hyaloscypha variabilis (strain UAMH 11265 / GT02V1 / F) TaxID=1149755 RepID=A0A2J6S9X2_HYAVF|nr:phospholipase D/nuclease [Hyaloscypha variabilis F]
MADAADEPSRKKRRLDSSVSPPPLRRKMQVRDSPPKVMKSPFQLTRITDLPPASNVDTISLKDILGDPLISECWEFNYLHNLDFLMDAFDEDVRDLVKVHVVHGFWKQEDPGRLNLLEQAKKYPNITLHTAYMPEMFGTHHTKMLVLVRHDAMAQIIIHTANMIPFDWGNMAQAVWKSPLLPLCSNSTLPAQSEQMGNGAKFKVDFLNYLRAYDSKRRICKPLIEQLMKYDFSEIRAALVGSVPGKQDMESDSKTSWGWAGLKNVLMSVPVSGPEPDIVVQISSIATLGQNDKWLDKTLFEVLKTSKNLKSKPKFHIIFPTADEIRRSLNGYASGSAIHTKIQTPAQAKQLQYLKPMLCHWAGDGPQHAADSLTVIKDAGRKRAAPHIKTYIRFADKTRSTIDWMLVTSANLSKQAWGEAQNPAGEIRVSSYELGVLIWPGLLGEKATMIPTFKTDTPPVEGKEAGELVIGARMPYDLPLVPYARGDEPWCATKSYQELDWKGMAYRLE